MYGEEKNAGWYFKLRSNNSPILSEVEADRNKELALLFWPIHYSGKAKKISAEV